MDYVSFCFTICSAFGYCHYAITCRGTFSLAIGWNIENVRSVLLPVPRMEALVLPGIVERANLQRPHAEYDIHS